MKEQSQPPRSSAAGVIRFSLEECSHLTIAWSARDLLRLATDCSVNNFPAIEPFKPPRHIMEANPPLVLRTVKATKKRISKLLLSQSKHHIVSVRGHLRRRAAIPPRSWKLSSIGRLGGVVFTPANTRYDAYHLVLSSSCR